MVRLAVWTSRFPDPWETFIEGEMTALAQERDVSLEIHVLKSGRATTLSRRTHRWWDPAHVVSWILFWVLAPKAMAGIAAELLRGFAGCPRGWERFKSFVIWPLACGAALDFQRRGVDHQFAHWANVPSTIAWMIFRLAGISYSMEIHGENISEVWPLLALKCREARGVAACTGFTGRRLEGSVEGLSVRLLRHGTCVPSNVSGAQKTSEVWRVLSIGRLVPTKGFATCARALGRLVREGVRLHWTLVGEGLEDERLVALAREEGVPLTRMRWRPHHDILAMYGEHDIFVLPCEVDASGDSDGLPNVLLEAMARGCPVVSTPVGGVGEAVREGETGWLCSPGDDRALAKLLAARRGDPDGTRQAADRARACVLENFEQETCRRRVVEAVREWSQ